MWSRKVKHFGFPMFYYKSELCERGRDNIVTTKKVHIQMRNRFVLRNEKTVIDKRSDQNENF